MSGSIYVKLFEPAASAKKKTTVAALATAGQQPPVDLAYVKRKLQSQREKSVSQLESLGRMFLENFSECTGISAHYAATDRDAAGIIGDAVGAGARLFANNSGTVQEIEESLGAVGVKISYNYLEDRNIAENRLGHPWLFPENCCDPAEDWFSVSKKFPLPGGSSTKRCYDATALIGVNSAAAADGTMFLLQHTSNIEKLLRSRRIVFLVAMEKIVSDQKQARFQTAWAGNFGLQNILLNLQKDTVDKRDSRQPLFPLKKTELKHGDSGPEITVIVLDNGRTSLLKTPYQQVLHCISCRSCMRECPTYKFFGKEKGRYPQLYLFNFLLGKIGDIDLCSFCNNCSYECPVGIDIAKMNSLVKARAHGAFYRAKTRLLGNAELLGAVTRATAPFAGTVFANPVFKLMTEKSVGIHRKRQLPVYDKEPIRRYPRLEKPSRKILYYAGCWAGFFEHSVYNSTLQVFNRLGIELEVVRSRCCGLPLIASGEVEAAKKKAALLVEEFSRLDAQADIITTCPSCSLALKKDYIDLGVKGAEQIGGRVVDIFQYLLDLPEIKNGKVTFRECGARLAYHLPCHQRVQDLGGVAIDALRLIPGLEVHDVNRGCCGISGAWGQKKQFYDYSMVTGGEVFAGIDPSQYSAVATECGTCSLQMAHGTGMDVVHPITVIADHLQEYKS
ncbi:anaerobic glycerol-3-phosphate dehydrogenase subunit C [Desulforhopalus singaporensis]|nr:anaerobic glycerol-3-phosphate dehydrogenase subunit C [Desulforhopalus singaporensis]